MKKLVSFWSFPFILTTCFSQGDSISAQALAQLKSEQIKMLEMWTDGDVETFKNLAGDDYLTINADGTYMNKEETYVIIPKFKGSTYKVIEQTDRVYGNLVISTGRAKFYLSSILAADVYFNQTWIYRNGIWQFINWQGTMTGVPKNYPIYFTLIITLIVLGIGYAIIRFRRKRV